MYANRAHANRPTPLSANDRVRQQLAIARADKARRKAAQAEWFNAFLAVALICGVLVAMLRTF
jgi:hypothetical protein